ncbi:heavy-metal-associated domain-containing protein [Cryptosporangium minutisporangium]|uniref:HMA domain-containing protein n=1 Tax=Cryptosporangium minutisporangium TaxID=113569 RepID=A0ABP6T1P5_9ACTN
MADTLTTLTIQVTGMHCASCGLLVDEAVEDLPGVKASSTSVRAATTTVELDTARCAPADVLDAINATGYAARLDRHG